MKSLSLIVASTLVVLSLGAANSARADSASMRFGYGLNGEAELDGEQDSTADLDGSLAGDIVFTHGFQEAFGVGLGLGFVSWLGDDASEDTDRNTLIDLTLRPEGRIGAGQAQLFIAGMAGISYSMIGEDNFFGGEIESALGFHYGLELGARFRVADWGGFEGGLALIQHQAEHEVTFLGLTSDVDGTVTNLLLRVGAFFETGSGY